MEASGSVLVDKSLYTKRNNASVPGFNGGDNSNVLLMGSASQRRLNIHGAGTWGPYLLPYAPYQPPAPTYSSLPNPNLLQHAYPPLLPLPTSKSLSLPPPSPQPSSTRVGSPAAVYSVNRDQKKPRSSPPNPKKDPQRGAARPQKVASGTAPPARVPKRPATTVTCPYKDEKPEEEEMAFTNDVYALSPSPSSLPMPKFSLRPRSPSARSPASCNAEAFGGGVAADAGASDGLRRLLRL